MVRGKDCWHVEQRLISHCAPSPPAHRSVIPKPRRVRRRPAVDHSLEACDARIGHAKPPIVMTDHGMDAPVLRILSLFEDWSIERLPHAEHEAPAYTNFGAKPHNELLMSAFRRVCHVKSLRDGSATASISADFIPYW